MKKEKNELLEFLGGIAMLAVGLYWFSMHATVSSSFFSSGFHFGSVNLNSGIVVVPFIIAIILVFSNPDSFGRKLFLGISILLIIASIIYTTTIRLSPMSLFEWILILVLIFGGLALVCKILFKPIPGKKDKNKDKE